MTAHDCFPHRISTLCSIVMLGICTLPTDLTAQRMRIGSSNPTGCRAGSTFTDALFAASDTTNGAELWHVGASGTNLLHDIYPGSRSSYPTEITRRSTSNGNTWLVAHTTAANGEIGRELHYYPNLPSSTSGGFVMDIRPGKDSSHPSELTLVGTRLFFVANDGTNGRELWTSNGTTTTTAMVKDIEPGAKSSSPFGLISFAGKVFFAATSGSSGTELWCSDGTSAGTVQVKDIYAGKHSSTPSHFAVLGKRLFFAATTDAAGRELWFTDGSAANTVLHADINAGSGSSSPTQMTAGSTLAFTASTPGPQRELYVLNPTTGNPVRKSNLPRGETIGCLTAVGSGFWFRAFGKTVGHELFRTAPSGIVLVHDLRAGTAGSYPSNIQVVGKGVIFRANDGKTGMEPWHSDGATATLIQDIRPGKCSSRPSKLTPLLSTAGTKFLFAAKGDHNGIEFWQTDSKSATLLRDIDPLKPLPGLHWRGDATGSNIVIKIKDAQAGQFAWVVIGTAVSPPFTPIPNARGALAVNLQAPVIIFSAPRLNNAGETEMRFAKPPINERTTLLSQAICSNTGDDSAAFLEISAVSTCNHGFRDLNPPHGPRVEGEICLDDESGEYSVRGFRTDGGSTEAFLGLYQKGPGGDLELLQTYPISNGEEINDSGQIEILLPLEFFDAPGRHLELHLFTEEPTPEGASSSSLVVQSYC
ncbi:MAG: ELWxxDGT repeat protein [Planctomycetota bacterium]|nr:ELWxxDGT repeat protein [Planctomycetota bacterium]